MERKCVFDQNGECTALEKKKCFGCSFFKTERQLIEGRRKAEERLKSLGIYDEMRRKYKKFYSSNK